MRACELPVIPGLHFLQAVFPDIAAGPAVSGSAPVCSSCESRTLQKGPFAKKKKKIMPYRLPYHVFKSNYFWHSLYWEIKVHPFSSFWVSPLICEQVEQDQWSWKHTKPFITHSAVQFQPTTFDCYSMFGHALPRLWPTTETAPTNSGWRCLKSVCRRLISEATVSTMVWQ